MKTILRSLTLSIPLLTQGCQHFSPPPENNQYTPNRNTKTFMREGYDDEPEQRQREPFWNDELEF